MRTKEEKPEQEARSEPSIRQFINYITAFVVIDIAAAISTPDIVMHPTRVRYPSTLLLSLYCHYTNSESSHHTALFRPLPPLLIVSTVPLRCRDCAMSQHRDPISADYVESQHRDHPRALTYTDPPFYDASSSTVCPFLSTEM